jgi:hypothetical protein
LKREYRFVDVQEKKVQVYKMGKWADKLYPWISNLIVYLPAIAAVIIPDLSLTPEQMTLSLLMTIVVAVFIREGFYRFCIEKHERVDESL